MNTYSYTCISFRDGKEVGRRAATIDSVQLYHFSVGFGNVTGELAFLRLLNRWNQQMTRTDG